MPPPCRNRFTNKDAKSSRMCVFVSECDHIAGGYMLSQAYHGAPLFSEVHGPPLLLNSMPATNSS